MMTKTSREENNLIEDRIMGNFSHHGRIQESKFDEQYVRVISQFKLSNSYKKCYQDQYKKKGHIKDVCKQRIEDIKRLKMSQEG